MYPLQDDKAFVNETNYSLFCNTNEHLLKGAPRGIVLEFPGLGGGSCLGGSPDLGPYNGQYAELLAGEGLILAYVHTGPWSWMNDAAVRFTDLVVDALRDKYSLYSNTPIAATGGSMGGQGALRYSFAGRNQVTACAVTCPCVDLKELVFVRDEFPRTFVSAFGGIAMSISDALACHSPATFVRGMHNIPYLILADEKDEIVPLIGIEDYVEKMRSSGHDVDYVLMKNCGHGGFTEEGLRAFRDFVLSI